MCWFYFVISLTVAFFLGWFFGKRRQSCSGQEPECNVRVKLLPASVMDLKEFDFLQERELLLSKSGTKVHFWDDCPGLSSSGPVLQVKTMCKFCLARGTRDKRQLERKEARSSTTRSGPTKKPPPQKAYFLGQACHSRRVSFSWIVRVKRA